MNPTDQLRDIWPRDPKADTGFDNPRPQPRFHKCPKCGAKALGLWHHIYIFAKCENCGHTITK